MIHPYGVTRAAVAVPPLPGVDGERLHAVAVGDLAAIVSDHAEPPPPTGPRLLDHDRVLRALLPQGVVPVRYGLALPDRAVLAGLLAERAEELHRLLERVRGRLEVGIRLALPAATPQVAASGRAWLLGKLDQQRTAARLAAALDRALGPLAVDRKLLAAQGDLRVAYLVEAPRVAEFKARAGALAGSPVGKVACTGPWPAYSFVAEDQP